METEDQSEDLSSNDFAKLLSGAPDDQASEQSDDAGDPEAEAGAELLKALEPPDDQADTQSDDELEFEQDGQKVKAKKADVIKAYQDREAMQRDYTQKTQRAAEESRQSQELARAEFEFVNRFAVDVSKVVTLSEQVKQYEQIPWQQLAQQDPQLYAVRLSELTELRHQTTRAATELQQKKQGFEQYQAQTQAHRFTEVWDHMGKVDKAFGKERLNTMFKDSEKYGFRPEELNNISDKRLVHMWSDLHKKAAAYDEIVKKQPQTQKQIAATPSRVNKAPVKPSSRQEQIIKTVAKGPISTRDFASLLSLARK